jgi:saccharopine dehydrogenase-like NADP-dependent oxidoreductase
VSPSGHTRIAVIGGAGAMGRITIRDLAETAPAGFDLVLADRDLTAARRVAATLPRRVKVVRADACSPRNLARVLSGAGILINACHHSLNLAVMDAALILGAHYCDLGGLFHVTKQQLRRNAEFKRAGLLALCGIGSAPGIVNVMARASADRFDRVEAVHIAVGTIDRTPKTGTSLLDVSYSLLTVLDEASSPAALFTGGRLRFVPPLSHEMVVDFPPPVGRQRPACTLHSELATIPHSFKGKGVREVSFRIAFPGDLTERLRFVHALGLTSTTPVPINGARVVPRDVLLSLVTAAGQPVVTGPRDEHEVLRVVVEGTRGSRRISETQDCRVTGMPAWHVGVDIDTGAPPSIAAQMLAAGAITARGVQPPERAIPPEPFFEQLARRRMRITRRLRRK